MDRGSVSRNSHAAGCTFDKSERQFASALLLVTDPRSSSRSKIHTSHSEFPSQSGAHWDDGLADRSADAHIRVANEIADRLADVGIRAPEQWFVERVE